MPYADNGHVSTASFEGAIEISEAQYLEAIEGMCGGMIVTIDGGFKVAPPAVPEPSPSTEPDLTFSIMEENMWREMEMTLIADQLLRIEDGDPTALPGTDRQWRDYRIQLRAWVEGADHFPDVAYRPARPVAA